MIIFRIVIFLRGTMMDRILKPLKARILHQNCKILAQKIKSASNKNSSMKSYTAFFQIIKGIQA
jgi:hypothetical protein